MPKTAEEFWNNVDTKGPHECWPWKGGTLRGYGRVYWKGKRGKQAHRVAWEIVFGPLEEDELVLHQCDNKPCCNVNHLFKGTHQVNQSDKVLKGRQARGEQNGKTTRSDGEIDDIRRRRVSGESIPSIAKSIGAYPSYVSRVCRNEIRTLSRVSS